MSVQGETPLTPRKCDVENDETTRRQKRGQLAERKKEKRKAYISLTFQTVLTQIIIIIMIIIIMLSCVQLKSLSEKQLLEENVQLRLSFTISFLLPQSLFETHFLERNCRTIQHLWQQKTSKFFSSCGWEAAFTGCCYFKLLSDSWETAFAHRFSPVLTSTVRRWS